MNREPDTQKAFDSLNEALSAINRAFDDLINLKKHKLLCELIENRAYTMDHLHESKYKALASFKQRYDHCGGGLE